MTATSEAFVHLIDGVLRAHLVCFLVAYALAVAERELQALENLAPTKVVVDAGIQG